MYKSRVLTAKNLQKAAELQEYMWEYYEKKNVEKRLARIKKIILKNKRDHRTQRLYDKLDLDLLKGIQLAKKKLGKSKNKRFEFSPELVKAGKTVRYWKLRVTAETSGFDFWQQLDALREDIEVDDKQEYTIQELTKRKQDAYKYLRQVQSKHVEHRATYLEIHW